MTDVQRLLGIIMALLLLSLALPSCESTDDDDAADDDATDDDTGDDDTGDDDADPCSGDAANTTVGAATTITGGDTLDGIMCGGPGAMDYYFFTLTHESFNATVTFASAEGDLDLYYLLEDGTTELYSSSGGVDQEVIELEPGDFAIGMGYILRVDLVEGDELPYTISLDMF